MEGSPTASTSDAPARRVQILRPRRGLVGLDFAEIWHHRELFLFLAWRDVAIQYKQTLIGIAWALIRPLLTMVVFTIIFGMLAKLPSQGVPYPILTLVALLPWQYFSQSLSKSAQSLVGNQNMITKLYFPRLALPTSSVLSSVVDFLISFVILAGLMIWYQAPLRWEVLFLPVFFLWVVVVSLGTAFWFSALNVTYRDVRYVIPFIVQMGLYISPVGFASAVVPERYRIFYALNPLVGVIDGFRWCLLDSTEALYLPGVLVSASVTVVIVLSGLVYFRNMERTFADVV